MPAAGDIVFSCHLDHEKPGANDNASGCAANLEIARTLKTLIDAEADSAAGADDSVHLAVGDDRHDRLSRRNIRRSPSRIRAAVHLDMVGGDPFITKSVLHVTRSPWSIATVTDDVEETFGRYVIDGAMRAAGEGDMTRAIRARGGSKDAFWADITPYESGSDHWIYQEGGFAIPSIYLRDHPDIYIHTTGDLPDNIEPTKIKRSAFIAAASGYYLATMPDHGASLLRLTYANAHERLAEDGRRASAMAVGSPHAPPTPINIVNQGLQREQRRLRSLARFVNLGADPHVGADYVDRLSAGLADAAKGLLLTLPPAGPRRGGGWPDPGAKSRRQGTAGARRRLAARKSRRRVRLHRDRPACRTATM